MTKRCLCVFLCIPLALEGEDGEERITGFFRLLLDLLESTGLGEAAALL